MVRSLSFLSLFLFWVILVAALAPNPLAPTTSAATRPAGTAATEPAGTATNAAGAAAKAPKSAGAAAPAGAAPSVLSPRYSIAGGANST